jgi:hypothetical protein
VVRRDLGSGSFNFPRRSFDLFSRRLFTQTAAEFHARARRAPHVLIKLRPTITLVLAPLFI